MQIPNKILKLTLLVDDPNATQTEFPILISTNAIAYAGKWWYLSSGTSLIPADKSGFPHGELHVKETLDEIWAMIND